MKVELTKYQLLLLLFIMQTGFVYTSFQNLVIEHGHRDATIQFLAVAVIFYFQLLFFERTYRYFVFTTFTKYLYLMYWFMYLITFVVYITYVLTTWVFIQTPTFVLISIFLVTCYYASVSRPETAVNLGVVLIPMLIMFFFFIFRAIPNLEITNLLPLFYEPSKTWYLGIIFSAYAFGGAETYLILRRYLLKKEKITYTLLTLYFAFLTLFYFISIAFTLMFFSLKEISLIPEPIFYILHSLEVTFVKRLDLFFIYIWLSWSLISIVNFVLVMRLVYFKKNVKKPKLQLLVFFVVIGVIANILTRYTLLDFFKHYLVYGILSFSLVFPLLIIFINKLRGRKLSVSKSSS